MDVEGQEKVVIGVPVTQTPARYIPQPLTATGVFNHNLFKIGAIGFFLSTATLMICGFAGFFRISTYYYWTRTSLLIEIPLASTILVSLFGFLAFKKYYNSQFSGMVFKVGLLFVVIFIIRSILPIFVVEPYCQYYVACPSEVRGRELLLNIFGIILLGCLYILQGIAFIIVKDYTGHSTLSLAAGVVLLIGGSIFSTFFVMFIGSFILFAAVVVAGIALAQARVPLTLVNRRREPVQA